MNEKFNRLMPESEGPTLCYELNKPISKEGYEENFLKPARAIIASHGELRLLLYYTSFKGWEEQAAEMDIGTYLEMGPFAKKIALVNAPDKEVMSRMLRMPTNKAELRLFSKERLQDAIDWVKN